MEKRETVTHGMPSSRYTINLYKMCRDPVSTALWVWQVIDKDHLRVEILFPVDIRTGCCRRGKTPIDMVQELTTREVGRRR
jgi:hypothetical protein